MLVYGPTHFTGDIFASDADIASCVDQSADFILTVLQPDTGLVAYSNDPSQVSHLVAAVMVAVAVEVVVVVEPSAVRILVIQQNILDIRGSDASDLHI